MSEFPPSFRAYATRMRGSTRSVAPPNLKHIVHAWIGAFLGLFCVSMPTLYLHLPATVHVMLIGSFGATVVLLHAAPRAELSQPRNLVGGHVLSALVGVTAHKVFDVHLEWGAAVAVATAIAVMMATRTLHPPGGATALIAVIGGKGIFDLGYRYVLTPVLVGVAIMLAVALLVNNLSGETYRQYPASWR
jgi:CBS-domain-containing membrane protein